MCCLSDDENSRESAAWQAQAGLQGTGGKNPLQDSYATMPMHFLPPLYPDDTGWAYAYW